MKLILVLSLFASGLCIFAQEPAPAATTPQEAPPVKPVKPKSNLLAYKAPSTAGTVQRKDGDGASRELTELTDGRIIDMPNLYALTPKTGAALTTKAKPTLFTFQTHEVPYPVEYRVTIIKHPSRESIYIDARLSSAGGFHRLDLAETSISLEPGVEYEWVALLRPNRNKKSSDVDARGSIKRIVPDAALKEKIGKADAADLAGVYAEAGIWYDALEAISDQIAANPMDKDLLAARKSLLDLTAQPLVEKAAKPAEKPKKTATSDIDLR